MFASTFCKGDYFRTLPLQLVEQRLMCFLGEKDGYKHGPGRLPVVQPRMRVYALILLCDFRVVSCGS